MEAAERSSVVVDLRDAEVARLELLNEALDPLFAEIPAEIELFDRGLSRGETPRLWVDAVAHVAMGRDKRIYRLLQDTRVGRRVLAESHEIPSMVKAVTEYVARRLVERERALEEDPDFTGRIARREVMRERRRRHRRMFGALLFGFCPRPRHAGADCPADGRSLLRKLLPLEFADAAVGAVLPRDHLAAPGSWFAINVKEIIAGGVLVTVRGVRRGRRRTDCGNALARPVEPDQ